MLNVKIITPIEIHMQFKRVSFKSMEDDETFLFLILMNINGFDLHIEDDFLLKNFNSETFKSIDGGNAYSSLSVKDNIFNFFNSVSGCGGDTKVSANIKITSEFKLYLDEIQKFMKHSEVPKSEWKEEYNYIPNTGLNIDYLCEENN
jgi:hypothetical protein